jgi:hypothetical protein
MATATRQRKRRPRDGTTKGRFDIPIGLRGAAGERNNIVIDLHREGEFWYRGYSASGKDFSFAVKAGPALRFASRETAIGAACASILAGLLRAMESASTTEQSRDMIRQVAIDVRKFRQKHEKGSTPARLVGELSGALANANRKTPDTAEPKVQGPRSKVQPPPKSARTNEHGVVISPKTIRVSLPKSYKAKASVEVAYLVGPGKPGWRAEFDTQCRVGSMCHSLSPIRGSSTPHATEQAAVSDGLERLAQFWDAHGDRHGANADRKRSTAIAREVRIFRIDWLMRHKVASPGSAIAAAAEGSRSKVRGIAVQQQPLPGEDGPLCVGDRKRLALLEKIIDDRKEAFRELGEALAEIRDRRFYRETHETFEAYCRERFGFGKAEAYDKIKAAGVAKSVLPVVTRLKLPAPIEDHLKALAPVAEEADRRAIYEAAAKRAKKEGVPITGRLLREERRTYETAPEDLERGKFARGPKKAPTLPTDHSPLPTAAGGPLVTLPAPPRGLADAAALAWTDGVANLTALARTLAWEYSADGRAVATLLICLAFEVAPAAAHAEVTRRSKA